MKRTTKKKTVRSTDNSMFPQGRVLLPFLVWFPLVWSSECIKFFWCCQFSPSFPVGNTAATYRYIKSKPKSLNNSNCNKNSIADTCVRSPRPLQSNIADFRNKISGLVYLPTTGQLFLAPVTVVLISLSLAREEHRHCHQERYTAASEHAPAVHHSYDPVRQQELGGIFDHLQLY